MKQHLKFPVLKSFNQLIAILLCAGQVVGYAAAAPGGASDDTPRYANTLTNSPYQTCSDSEVVNVMRIYNQKDRGSDQLDLQNRIDAARVSVENFRAANDSLYKVNTIIDPSAGPSEKMRYEEALGIMQKCSFATAVSERAIAGACMSGFDGNPQLANIRNQMLSIQKGVVKLGEDCASLKASLDGFHKMFLDILNKTASVKQDTPPVSPKPPLKESSPTPAVRENPAPQVFSDFGTSAPAVVSPSNSESGVGNFFKKNGKTIGIAAASGIAGVGLAALLNKKDNKDAQPAAAAATTPATTAATTTTTLNKPTDTSVQAQQLSLVPTETTSPVSATANATANDPAYTGVGSAQGDTSGTRDSSAGTFLTTFGCLDGESDSVCRARLGCSATEAMATCQTRWNSGVIATTN